MLVIIVINFGISILLTPKIAQAETWGEKFSRWGNVTLGVAGTVAAVTGCTALGFLATPASTLLCIASLGVGGAAVVTSAGNIVSRTTAMAVADKISPSGTPDEKKEALATKIEEGQGGSVWASAFEGLAYLLFQAVSGIFSALSVLLDEVIKVATNTALLPTSAIEVGWTMVRDTANMFFIFLLLYISISTILSLSGADTWKLLGKLILVALLINFSLAFTYTIIDFSNVVARHFLAASGSQTIDGTYSIAKRVEQAFGTAALISTIASQYTANFDNKGCADTQHWNPDLKRCDEGPPCGPGEKRDTHGACVPGDIGVLDPLQIGLTYLGVSAVLLVAAFVLGSGASMFLVRLMKLMLLTILSPLAFIGAIIPSLTWWSEWWKTLIGEAFMAPTFLFFIYIASIILVAPSGDQFLPNGSYYDKAINYFTFDRSVQDGNASLQLVLRFGLVTALFALAIVAAHKVAGETAKTGGKMAGFAFGTAAGVGAATLRQTVGRGGQMIAESQGIKDLAAKDNIIGTLAGAARGMGDYASKSSFEARNAPILGSAMEQAAGIAKIDTKDLQSGASLGSLYNSNAGDKKTAGGFAQAGGLGLFHPGAEARATSEKAAKDKIEADKKKVFDATRYDLLNNLKTIDPATGTYDNTKIQSSMNTLDDRQFLSMADDIFKPENAHLLNNLSEHHVTLLSTRGDISQANKAQMKTAITAATNTNTDGKKFYKEEMKKQAAANFGSAVLAGPATPATGPALSPTAHIQAELNKLDPKAIIHTDPAVLSKPEVAREMSGVHLQSLLDEYMSGSGRVQEQTLKDIRANATGPSATKYFSGPAGLIWPI
ncbi:MAG: hypothetical protein HY226_04550 [Candidatus Vogelbacteria bacterium]|nr:hypothetical protein [Candidatus Vogelbacteria bacterium]